DVARQGQGHADMVGIVFATLFPDAQAGLSSRWNGVRTGVSRSAADARQQATELRAWLDPFRARLVETHPDKGATKRLLERILDSGQTLGSYRGFSPSPQTRVSRSVRMGCPPPPESRRPPTRNAWSTSTCPGGTRPGRANRPRSPY